MILADQIKRTWNQKTVLNDISFYVEPGEMAGIVGKNGAGKTTLIKILAGLLTVSSGHIWVMGNNPHTSFSKNRKSLGVLFAHQSSLWKDMSLKASFELCRHMYHIPLSQYREILKTAGEAMAIFDFWNEPVSGLSLGQRMRGEFLYSILPAPKLLLLDEPTIGVDPSVKESMNSVLRWLNDTYRSAILISSHDLIPLKQLCKRTLVLDNGCLLFDGTWERLLKKYHSLLLIRVCLQEGFIDLEDLPVISYQYQNGYMELWFDSSIIRAESILRYLTSHGTILDLQIMPPDIDKVLQNFS